MASSVFRERWGIRLGVFASLCLVLLVLRFHGQRRELSAPIAIIPPASVRSLAQIHIDWQKAVRDILTTYEQDHQAIRARDALLALTVAPTDQQTHLQLVLALNAVSEGASKADAKWKAAKQAFLQQPSI